MVVMARKGLPSSIVKKYGVSRKAWSVFRGGAKKAKSHAITTRVKRVVSMARRKRRSYYRRVRSRFHRPKAYPLAVIFPLAGGLVGPAQTAMGGDWQGALKQASVSFTGFDLDTGAFVGIPEATKNILIGALIHKAATMIGVNRALAGLPRPLNKIAI